jgi:hypothetical protein
MDIKQEVLKDVETYRLKLLKAKTADTQEPNRSDTPIVAEDVSSEATSVTSHTDTYAGLREIGACVIAASTSISTIDKSMGASTVKEASTQKEVESVITVERVKEVLGFVIALITALRNVDWASVKPQEVATKGFKFLVCMIFFLLWPSHVERKGEVPRPLPPPPIKKVSLLHLAKG